MDTENDKLILGKSEDKSDDNLEETLEDTLNETPEDTPEDTHDQDEVDNFDILFYQNEMLNEEDDKLINKDTINNNVLKYYQNYYSEDYQTYLKLLKSIPQKYNRKSYEIVYQGKDIIVNKIIGEKKRNHIGTITKPKYQLNINEFLYSLKTDIRNRRNSLMIEYKRHLSTDNITMIDKNTFLQHKKEYIELLERYYSIKKYYMKINNISYDNKKNILIYNLEAKINNNDTIKELIECNVYKISNNLIDQINQTKKNKLELYNEIMRKYKLNEDVTDEEIKDYLNKEEYNNNNKILNNEIKKLNNTIDYYIEELPSFINLEKLLE
jgi:hypothetical protein